MLTIKSVVIVYLKKALARFNSRNLVDVKAEQNKRPVHINYSSFAHSFTFVFILTHSFLVWLDHDYRDRSVHINTSVHLIPDKYMRVMLAVEACCVTFQHFQSELN